MNIMNLQFRQFQIARPFGIPLKIDYSWPPVAMLHIWLVSKYVLPARLPELPLWQCYFFGSLMTGLLFVSILVHELAHCQMAQLEGIKIRDIQLHIFGGWARLENEPRTPMGEFRIAIVGPASSFLLALIFFAAGKVVFALNDNAASGLTEVFRYLSLANLLLAMFNLIPGLPLDGGRAFRAWMWHRKNDVLAATKLARQMGVALSYMLMSYGIYRAIWWRDLFSAVWILLVGYFLKNSADSDYRFRKQQRDYENAVKEAESRLREQWNIEGTVGSVMSVPAIAATPELSISQFVEQVLDKHRHTSFPVARDGRLHGIVRLERLREVPQEKWNDVLIQEMMQPVDDSLFVTVRTSIEHAASKLKGNQPGHLAVLDTDGFLVGYLSSEDLTQA
jgi:Zn-dependent protease